jgi:hypothetical protein
MAKYLASQTYLQYIQTLAHQAPILQVLADFASPDIWISGFHEDQDVVRRMTKIDVTVVDTKSSISCRKFGDLRSLTCHLNSDPGLGALRVILVEDLSRDLIELLGSKYLLDPFCFLEHVQGIQHFLSRQWTGSKIGGLRCSHSYIINRDFIVVEFVRPYEFETWLAVNTARKMVNVPRLGGVVRNLYLKEMVTLYGPVKTSGDYFICK